MIYYGVNHIHFWFGVLATLLVEYIALVVVYVVLKIKVKRLKKKLGEIENAKKTCADDWDEC